MALDKLLKKHGLTTLFIVAFFIGYPMAAVHKPAPCFGKPGHILLIP